MELITQKAVKSTRADETQLTFSLDVLWSQGCAHLGGADCYHMALESDPKLVYNTWHRKRLDFFPSAWGLLIHEEETKPYFCASQPQ